MLAVGTSLAVVCMESIEDPAERQAVKQSFESSGKEIIDITREQVRHLCGNVIELRGFDKYVLHAQVSSDTIHSQ